MESNEILQQILGAVNGIKTDVAELKTDVADIKIRTRKIEIRLETTIEPNIRTIADGHVDLYRHISRVEEINAKLSKQQLDLNVAKGDIREIQEKLNIIA